jgi:hypothetical protein
MMKQDHPTVTATPSFLASRTFQCARAYTHTRSMRTMQQTRTGLDHVRFGFAQRAGHDTRAERFKNPNSSIRQSTIGKGVAVLLFRDPDNIQLRLISMG